jgi:hypothetical protein
MARRQLEFKRRVRMSNDTLFEPVPVRRYNPMYLGAFAWFVFTIVSYFTINHWLLQERRGFARARTNTRTTRSSRIARAAFIEPAPSAPPKLATIEPPAAVDVPPAPLEPPQVLVEPPQEPPASSTPPAPEPTRRVSAADPKPELGKSRSPARARARELPPTQSTQRSVSGSIVKWEDLVTEEFAFNRQTHSSPRQRAEPGTAWAERSNEPRTPSAARLSARANRTPDQEPVAPAAGDGSCEAAVAKYNEQLDLEHPSNTPDISASAYGAILNNGSYFAHCGVPSSMTVNICAAVQHGRTVGVTVRTHPASSSIAGCVRQAVRRLRFPNHPKLDVTRTEFAPD